MLFSATIDFSSNAFLYDGPEGFLPLEKYEEHIRQLVVDGGIKKIYLRVNVGGLSNHPSKVVPVYGEDTACHWTNYPMAERLIKTMQHYDCCTETIRLAHKYGAEAWAWESLFDDAGICVDISRVPEQFHEIYRQKGARYSIDPFYLANPHAMAQRDPRLMPTESQITNVHKQVKDNGIGKIVFVNHPEWNHQLPEPGITSDNFQIFVSSNNRDFQLYKGNIEVKSGQDQNGRNYLEISSLDIREAFFKLVCLREDKKSPFTMVLRQPEGQAEIYDRNGKKLPSCWAVNDGKWATAPVEFNSIRGNAAWDCGNTYLAGCAGPGKLNEYLYGFAEFTVPAAMEHKVARFQELTDYDFDGFIFNTRSHSAVNFAEQYGYNPEVLAEFTRRYNREYSGSEDDIRKVFQIRAESVAEFFKRCKALTGGRPLFISGPMPLEYAGHPAYNTSFGPLPWLYKKYFADKSIDGVIMIGKNFENGVDFSEYFTNDITGNHPVKLGVFREMLGRPAGYDLGTDLEYLRQSKLDEVELYESVMLTAHPQSLRFLRGKAMPGEKMQWQ